jgi:hypothetical protein
MMWECETYCCLLRMSWYDVWRPIYAAAGSTASLLLRQIEWPLTLHPKTTTDLYHPSQYKTYMPLRCVFYDTVSHKQNAQRDFQKFLFTVMVLSFIWYRWLYFGAVPDIQQVSVVNPLTRGTRQSIPRLRDTWPNVEWGCSASGKKYLPNMINLIWQKAVKKIKIESNR